MLSVKQCQKLVTKFYFLAVSNTTVIPEGCDLDY